MTLKLVEGRKYSANLPSFNNLEEHRKGKQMQLKTVLPFKTILSYTFYRFRCHYPLITYLITYLIIGSRIGKLFSLILIASTNKLCRKNSKYLKNAHKTHKVDKMSHLSLITIISAVDGASVSKGWASSLALDERCTRCPFSIAFEVGENP